MTQRFLRMSEVKSRVGLSKATIYRLVAKGCFPRSIRLGEASVAWLEEDVIAWIAARVAESRSAA
jgi:prophage regulatory protein